MQRGRLILTDATAWLILAETMAMLAAFQISFLGASAGSFWLETH